MLVPTYRLFFSGEPVVLLHEVQLRENAPPDSVVEVPPQGRSLGSEIRFPTEEFHFLSSPVQKFSVRTHGSLSDYCLKLIQSEKNCEFKILHYLLEFDAESYAMCNKINIQI